MPQHVRPQDPASRRRGAGRRRRPRRLVALLLGALVVPLGVATGSMAQEITVPNPGGLVQADPVNPAHGFLVTAVDPARTVFRATAAPDAVSAAVADLVNGTRYTVRVRAVNSAGTGPSSAPVTVTPAAP